MHDRIDRLKLPDFLPGKLKLSRGSRSDYDALRGFHYVAGPPATWADIWVIRYNDAAGKKFARLRDHRDFSSDQNDSRVVAIAVLSYPVPSCRSRESVLRRVGFSRSENLRFANQHIRTISRVIVHPQFRSLGLSSLLVRTLCKKCATRYVEAMAAMGRAHPFFERAGMKRINPADKTKPVYFIFDSKGEIR